MSAECASDPVCVARCRDHAVSGGKGRLRDVHAHASCGARDENYLAHCQLLSRTRSACPLCTAFAARESCPHIVVSALTSPGSSA
jgi:hypothetical protein